MKTHTKKMNKKWKICFAVDIAASIVLTIAMIYLAIFSLTILPDVLMQLTAVTDSGDAATVIAGTVAYGLSAAIIASIFFFLAILMTVTSILCIVGTVRSQKLLRANKTKKFIAWQIYCAVCMIINLLLTFVMASTSFRSFWAIIILTAVPVAGFIATGVVKIIKRKQLIPQDISENQKIL